MNKKTYIAVVAARSGGHILPGLTLAHEHCKQHQGRQILFFSTNNSFDKQIINSYPDNITHISIPLDNVPLHMYKYPLFIAHCIYSFFVSLYYLIKFKPHSIFLMGGYISIPVCLAAKLLRIKRELYELNAVPGKATRLLAPLANHIHVCFKPAMHSFNVNKTKLTHYPIRFAKNNVSRTEAHHKLSLEESRSTLLVLGGSQGSVSLNKSFGEYLQKNPQLYSRINIIHQTGGLDTTDWALLYKNLGIKACVFAFSNNLALHYAAADLIIARAGAGTIFETLFFKKRLVLVPLEIEGNDHQLHNAQAIAREHPELCTVIRHKEFAIKIEDVFKGF